MENLQIDITVTSILWTVCGILGAVCAFFLVKYISGNDKSHEEHNEMFKVMSDVQSDLKSMVKLHDWRIKELEKGKK